MVDDDLQGLLNDAYFFLKFRPRTVKEMRNYLNKRAVKKHCSSDDIKKVIKHLTEENLINDEEFVRWFVEQRNSGKPESQFALKGELFRYGVPEELIEKYFSEVQFDEEDLASKALSSRWTRFKGLSQEARFQKAASFLLRRGFKFTVVKKTIDKLVTGE